LYEGLKQILHFNQDRGGSESVSNAVAGGCEGSLCNLCVLCVSVVKKMQRTHTTETQSTQRLHREEI